MSKIYCSLPKRRFKYKLLNFSLSFSLSLLSLAFFPSLFSSLSLPLSSSPLSLSIYIIVSLYTYTFLAIIWVSVTWRSLNYLHYLLYFIFNHRTKSPQNSFEEGEPKGLLTSRTGSVEKKTDYRDGHTDRTPEEGYLARRLITHSELWRSWKYPWGCQNPSLSP